MLLFLNALEELIPKTKRSLFGIEQFIKLFTTMELDSVHQVEDGNFFFIIQAVYNLSAMSWCTYLTVNNYIKVLQ